MRALGIDVAANRALDLVLMSGAPGSLRIEGEPYTCRPAELAAMMRAGPKPDVVAIDSPPRPGIRDKGREAELALFRRRIGIFWNPTSWDKPFYDWMKVGRDTFAAAAAVGYPLYERGDGRNPPSVRGRAIEVFPHASAVALRGKVWPPGTYKRARLKLAWRRSVLDDLDVDTRLLTNLDKVDAALAAVTGLYSLANRFTPVGRADEGVIVVPAKDLPDRYEREAPAS